LTTDEVFLLVSIYESKQLCSVLTSAGTVTPSDNVVRA